MLYERDDELHRLSDLASQSVQGGGSVVALSGEAGVGKSSLLSEFAKTLGRDFPCHWGMCDALFTPRPLGPVHDIAQALIEPDENGHWRDAGGSELFGKILTGLRRLDDPVVLIIEDVHWADVGTLDFIRFLGRRIALCKALLIVSFRDDEVGPDHALRRVLGDLPAGHVERMALAPLSLEAVRELAAGSERDAQELLRITGGNPFFVSEIISDQGGDETRVPESVQDAVASRLARLEDSHRKFLEALSIIPVSIDPAKHGTNIPNSEYWFEQSLNLGILVAEADGGLRFRHELARMATSQRCSAHELLRLHKGHLDRMLENPDQFAAGEIVHHAKGAADPDAVLKYAPIAGEQAARLGAHAEAASYYESALDFIDEAQPEQAATIYDNWAYEAGLALRIDDRVIDARRHALTLWRALGHDDKVAENLRWLSRMHWYRGEAAQAARHLDESITLFEQLGNAEKLAMAYSMRSQMKMLSSEMEEAIEWGERALDIASPDIPTEIEVHALNNIGTARLFRGQEQGVVDLKRSLELAQDHHLHEDAARVFTNLSEYAVDLGKLELAEAVLDEGIAFDIEHDLDNWTHYLRGRFAQLRLEQGRLSEAAQIAEDVLARPGQTMLMQLPARIMLARTQLRTGDTDALKTLEQSRADALKTGELQYQIPVLLAELERAWINDDDEGANEASKALDRIDPDRFSRGGMAERGFWQGLLGVDFAPAGELPLEAFNLAMAGDWLAASAGFSSSGHLYLAAICLGLCDDANSVSKALAELQKMRAAPANRRILELALKRGIPRDAIRIPRGPYKAAKTNSFGLTAKEQTVLKHMVSGLTNAEIAARLSRSPRTIEHHVSAILQKLGTENRLGAVLKAQQEPELAGQTPIAESSD